ncbi:MAG TPA: phosphotransferase [Frankiaceae bacterium]|nr:phosphotransferase [Frankiaceae bacterium]
MTQPAWTPEREITLAEARQLVAAGFPDLANAEVELFAQGWDNTAVRWRSSRLGELVFRFPRRAIALAGVRRELAWLPQLAPLLPIPIPHPTFAGSWSSEGSEAWPFWGAQMLPGTELAVLIELSPQQRADLAGQLGAFLRVLHDVQPGDFEIAGDAQLAVDPMDRGYPAKRAVRTKECLGRLRQSGVHAPFDDLAGLIDRAARLLAPPPPSVICHGDLHVRHVLVGGSAITGVIDWGDLCLADPAVDLSIAFAAFSEDQRQAFFTAYGSIDPDRELRARALAISLSALLTEYAMAQVSRDGSASPLLPEVSNGLSRALES